MRTERLQLTATIWPSGPEFLSLEAQHVNLWRVAKELGELGMPLNTWFPPAETEAESLLNKSFDASGPTPAALAMAKAMQNKELDSFGAWNGAEAEEKGAGMTLAVDHNYRVFPTLFKLGVGPAIAALDGHESMLHVLKLVLELWSPFLVEVAPYSYHDHRAFPDKPGVGWMLYLPFAIKRDQVPEAAEVIPVLGDDKKQKGTIVVSTHETFDVQNKAHVKLANAIEIRLVDQDLLMRRADIRKFR